MSLQAKPSTVVYEDDCLRVMHFQGSSAYLAITFAGLGLRAQGTTFFADKVLCQHGVSSLGFMPKAAHWYPAASMRAAALALAPLLQVHSTRLLYGGSMGAYAAIKYARLLGATHVLALAPQWSIDPQECRGHDSGYRNFYRPAMAGMGIAPGDVQGHVVAVADMSHALDAFHTRQIAAVWPALHVVNMPFVGHDVNTVLAGSQRLLSLFAALLAQDVAGIARLVAQRSRQTLHRLQAVSLRALERHPRWLMRQRRRQVGKPCVAPDVFMAWDLPAVLALRQSAASLAPVVLANRLAELRKHRQPGSPEGILLRLAAGQIVAAAPDNAAAQLPASPLRTHHQTDVVFDLIEQRLAHRALGQAAPRTSPLSHLAGRWVPCVLRVEGEVALLSLQGHPDLALKVQPDGKAQAVDNQHGEHSLFVLKAVSPAAAVALAHPVPVQMVTLQQLLSGRYLCAEPGGSMAPNRTQASQFERFSLSF